MELDWLGERRDLFLKNIVKDFFECLVFFQDLKEHTQKYGVRYDGFDFWVGTEENKGKLWILKDLCHLIWGQDQEQNDDGVMFDWMVGAIFHEAMKLKENAYMFERYQHSFPNKAMAILNGSSTKVVKEFFQEMIVEVECCIKRIDWLFEHAEKHLFQIIKEEKENALLVRFLLEDMSNKLSEEKRNRNSRTKKLLNSLFPEGLHTAYCLAGESYLEGGWFQEARDAFEKALEIKPDYADAKSGLRLLEKRLKELASFVNREFEIIQRNGTHFLN